MTLTTIISIVIIATFVSVHMFGAKLRFLSGTPRSVWLSGAGGVSVAYVFVHLLPDLAEQQDKIGERARDTGLFTSIESHAYLIALAGLIIFYGVERFARSRSGPPNKAAGGESEAPASVFWTHLGAFAIYNLLIGYLLVHREETDLRGLIIYGVAMALHFVVNDFGLREQHGETYHRTGRWVLAVAPVLGFALGLATEVSQLLLSSLFAFLAGGIVLNVLKEELPQERQSRFSAFLIGACLYAAMLLLTA
jgi:zinc transporter ZupT